MRERGQHPSASRSKNNTNRQEARKQTLHLVLNSLEGENQVARVEFSHVHTPGLTLPFLSEVRLV